MMANVHREGIAPGIKRWGVAAIVAAMMLTATSRASAQNDDDADDNTVTIVNASDQDLTYQVHRAIACTWTAPYTLPAGKLHRYTAPDRGRSPLATLTSHEEQPGFLVLRTDRFDGYASAKVLAGNTYWYLFDKHGNARLIRATNQASAERRLQELNDSMGEETAEEVARLTRQARANHLFRGP